MKKGLLFVVLVSFLSLVLPNFLLAQIHISTYQGDTVMGLFVQNKRLLFGVKCEPTCIQSFGESYKYGYLDEYGSEVIPAIYDIAYDFSDGLVVVGQCSNNGYRQWYILPDGQKLFNQTYVDVQYFVGDYAIVDKDGAYHMCHINKQGEPLYAQTYQWLYDFNQNGKAVGIRNINLSKDTCVWVVIDIKGEELLIIKGAYNVDDPPKEIQDFYF